MESLDDIFLNARQIADAAEQAMYLARACDGDAQLRNRVEAMLRDAGGAESFFGANGSVACGAGSARMEAEFARLKPEEAGDRIGNYKLLQQIGEGGFGTVWMADQSEPVKRRVALKIIKLGMDTQEVVARFEQERQALAMMDHPNIARVFDAGVTPTGRPFFVMELVRGIKITEYCDEQALSTDERIGLVVRVCHAVQHAHQKGIIHRDLKPSNILVTINDGEAVPKVIDFGVAKATQGHLSEVTLFTRFEQMIGTPLYMSPEQAELTSLDIDTRSDIYSLGVLLYELLTGRTPIDTSTIARAGMDEIRRIIREVDPPRPSARVKTLEGNELTTAAKRRHTDATHLPRALRGDIDWIVMKCLEKDRQRRYETANGLAADLQRHLRNEVVIARPPTTAYLLGKLIKRNKLAFMAAAAVAISLFIGMGATARQLIKTREAEQRAVSTLDELRKTAPAFAEQARALVAKEQFDQAIEKLDYAFELRPDVAEYLVAKADLLQCQLKLAEAAAVYRDALRLQPGLERAEASAKLCNELLVAKPAADGKLSRESLARLYVAMQQQQRPAAELVPVARLLGEEKKLLVNYWLARLKGLPIAGERPLEARLTVREDGQLALDLSGTKVVDLSPLAGAPLATLNAAGCTWLKNISPLRGTALVKLDISGTPVTDLTPLREMHTLADLDLSESHVVDLSPISSLRLKRLALADCAVSDIAPVTSMPLEEITLRGTRVSDLSPLARMPIKSIDLTNAPVLDFSALAKLPLEKCYLQRNRITDLSIFRGKNLKELVLWACADARNYSVLREIQTLELLLLPAEYRGLPADDYAAIGALRDHPRLRQIGSEIMGGMGYAGTGAKEVFWRDWDREQAFVPRLREAGVPFFLTRKSSGKYAVFVQQQRSFRDLSIFSNAPLEELHVASCDISDLTPLRGLQLRILSIAFNPVVDLGPLRGMPLEHLSASGTKVVDLTPLLGSPLKGLYLDRCENISDLGVLAAIPTLERVAIPVGAANVERLRDLPKLRDLSYQVANSSPFDPTTKAEQFWRDYESNQWIGRLVQAGIKPKDLKRLPDGTWELDLDKSPFSDLGMLSGAPISSLNVSGTAVKDLNALRGMKLTRLRFGNTAVTDLEPLRGMPLKRLYMSNTLVKDITVLSGMPLEELQLEGTPVTDARPLLQCPKLESLVISAEARNVEVLRAHPTLKAMSYTSSREMWKDAGPKVSEFWKQFDESGWQRSLRSAGIKATKLDRLADGTWDVSLRGSSVTDLEILRGVSIALLDIGNTAVTDLTPLRGMPLKTLWLYNTKVTDLSPLEGMKLEYFHASGTLISDISVLRGMPLQRARFHGCKRLTDLSPLADAKDLTELTIPEGGTNYEFLRSFPKLDFLSYWEHGSERRPGWAEEFWREYDAKKAAGSVDLSRQRPR